MKQTKMLIIFLAIALGLFLGGTYLQGVNENSIMEYLDQSAYMEYARILKDSNYNYSGERNRMPLYPGLMSLFLNENMSDEVFFRIGKITGVIIALGVSVVAFFLFKKVSNSYDAAVAALVTLFTVFAYKAPYFHPEILFYGINLVLFYLLVSLIRKPRIGIAALAGITAGLGHLTKASVLPGLLLAALCLIIRGAMYIKNQRHEVNFDPSIKSKARHFFTHVSYVIILLGCFLVVIYPYIKTSKEQFGRYFYNVNSTFYMWYDSWNEAKHGTRAHGDRVGWPDLPDDQIPSFRKYIEDHTLKDIAKRFFIGSRIVWKDVTTSYGYVEFLGVYAVVIVLLLWQNKDWAKSLLTQTNPSLLLFILGYFSGYLILYTWYMSIIVGNRFVLSLFLPAMLVLLSLLSKAQSADLNIKIIGKELSASLTSRIVLLMLLAYLVVIYPIRVGNMYGGE